MILEVAMLNVKLGQEGEFEQAFVKAAPIIASVKGYVSHEIRKSIEVKGKYALLVKWETLEDHTVGFRQSAEYQEWRKLLHHFYDPFPVVEHFEDVKLGE